MPTMPKLFAAALMAALGWVAAGVVAGRLPPEIPPGYLPHVSALFGVLVGWRFLGPRMGGGVRTAAGLGLSSVVILVLLTVLWFSGYEMLRRATRMAYGGDPFAALQDMVQIALENFMFLGFAEVIGVLVLGGVLVGAAVEVVASRWS